MPAKQVQFGKLVPSHIQALTSYIPSKPDSVLQEMFQCPVIYRLNNNENALGPAPEAIKAIQAFQPAQAAVYPSGDAYLLRHRLAECFGHEPDAFFVGFGDIVVIAFVVKALCQAGDNIVTGD